jgi:ribose transport system substrate-binding protein
MKGDARYAFDWAQESLALNGDKKVDVFVCLDSSSGKAVADALKRAKVTDRLMVAWDVDADTLNDIKDGIIDSTVVQKPYTMGYVGLKALDEVYHNKPKQLSRDNTVNAFASYPVFVDTGTSLVDKTNVDSYIAAEAEGAR